MKKRKKVDFEKKYNKLIIALSIVIPLVVVVLFGVKLNVKPLWFLPPIYATINGITAVLLVWAVLSIRKGNRKLHEKLVKIAICCSALFLAMYVAYHMTSDSTPYGGQGTIRYVYYFLNYPICLPIHIHICTAKNFCTIENK